jgi:outer membrane protein OmpA-like peptidoglycan-associated protein
VVGRDHTTVGLDEGKTLESFGRTTEELAGLADAPVDLVVREDAGLTVGGRGLELGEGSVVLGPTATGGMADGSMTSVPLGDHDMGGERELRGDERVASDGLNREVEAAASTVLEPEQSASAPASAVAEARDPQIDAESVDDLLASTLLPRGTVQSGPAAVERGNGMGAQVEVAGSSDGADGPTKPPLSRDVTPESKAAARVSPSLSELATALDLVGIPVERAEGGRVRIDLGERVQFGSGSTTLSTDAKEFLEELAVILMQSAPLSVQVIGHTDRQGGREVNLMLSERRAEAVMMFLIDQGLSASHLKSEGRGESEPKVGLARERVLGPTVNRRIEIEVAPLADGEPDAS